MPQARAAEVMVVADRTVAAVDSMVAEAAAFAAAGVSAAAALEAHGLMAGDPIAVGSEEGGRTAEAHTEAVHSEAPAVLGRPDLDAALAQGAVLPLVIE